MEKQTVLTCLEGFKFTIKKDRRCSGIVEIRYHYAQAFLHVLEQIQFILVDETGFNVAMRRSRGRARKGQQLEWLRMARLRSVQLEGICDTNLSTSVFLSARLVYALLCLSHPLKKYAAGRRQA